MTIPFHLARTRSIPDGPWVWHDRDLGSRVRAAGMRFGRSLAQRHQPPDLVHNDARSVGPSHIIRGRWRPRNWWWRYGPQCRLCRVHIRTGHGSGPYLVRSRKGLGYRRGDFDANHQLGGPYQRVPFRRRSGSRRARASRWPRIPPWLEPRSRWVSHRVALRRPRVWNRHKGIRDLSPGGWSDHRFGQGSHGSCWCRGITDRAIRSASGQSEDHGRGG